MENLHDINLKQIGARIRTERKVRGLTQAQAGEQAFISGQYWSLLESGRERASVSTYLRIVEILGLTMDDIFYDNATIIRLHKAFTFDGILDDCTSAEKAIISETVLGLKGILERNRSS